MLVLVVVMGFLRMRRSVHAKKNLPHQLLKDKARLQSAKCRHPQNGVRPGAVGDPGSEGCFLGPGRAEARPSALAGFVVGEPSARPL